MWGGARYVDPKNRKAYIAALKSYYGDQIAEYKTKRKGFSKQLKRDLKALDDAKKALIMKNAPEYAALLSYREFYPYSDAAYAKMAAKPYAERRVQRAPPVGASFADYILPTGSVRGTQLGTRESPFMVDDA